MCSAATNNHAEENPIDIHLDAYNAAFCELGLKWHWNAGTYLHLQSVTDAKCSIQTYLETQQAHLLKAYDVHFLTDMIHSAKNRCYELIIARGSLTTSPVDWAEIQRHEIGF